MSDIDAKIAEIEEHLSNWLLYKMGAGIVREEMQWLIDQLKACREENKALDNHLRQLVGYISGDFAEEVKKDDQD